jgi:hypothetical protein
VLAQLLGQLNACVAAVQPAPLHFRQVYMLESRALIQGHSYEAPVILPQACKEELRWWFQHLEIWNGKEVITPGTVQTWSLLRMHRMLHRGPLKTKGLRSPRERLLHINILELMAAVFAVRSFAKDQSNLHIHLMADNTPTNSGATRYLSGIIV